MTENIQLSLKSLRDKYNRESIYFFFLWAQVLTAIVITLFNVAQPIQLLILQTFFSALSMFVLSALVLWLNNSRFLPFRMRPGIFRNIMLLFSTLFFGIFVLLTILDLV